MKKDKIITFYDERMVLQQDSDKNMSLSPLKPKKLMEYLRQQNLLQHFDVRTFPPFREEDFLIAHFPEYVEGFFKGEYPHHESNGLQWSEQFAETVKYTNASLYHAILHAVQHPEEVAFSPTAGFHHASPVTGDAFCTFSGQVIASVKIYRQSGLRGAYLDLDGHYGNSIEDSRAFCPILEEAIPPDCNINPLRTGDLYIRELRDALEDLFDKIMEGKVDYVVFCHGADSHEWDDFGGNCSTEQWIQCAKMVYRFIHKVEKAKGKPFPLALSLFGGYRRDDYSSVLSLHTASLAQCLDMLCGQRIGYKPKVKPGI